MKLWFRSIMLFASIMTTTADKKYNVYYSAVAPSSYICLCIPAYIVKHVSDNNITDWDGECSNDQVCFWNSDEVLIKYWYSPIN